VRGDWVEGRRGMRGKGRWYGEALGSWVRLAVLFWAARISTSH